MSFPKYEPIRAEGEKHPGDAGSAESSSRLTPDSDPEDEQDLDDLEDEEGLELKELGRHSPTRVRGESSTGGAEREEESESDEEDNALPPQKSRRRGSVASFELYTPDEEHKVRRKLDIRLVLFVALLYLL